MLPITKIPPLVAESAEHFKPVFSWHKKDAGSSAQKVFCHFLAPKPTLPEVSDRTDYRPERYYLSHG